MSVAKISKSKYVITRYGNVLSSKGSIVPLFLKQANDPKCAAFTITDVDMTRFLMTLEESVDLIDKALSFGSSGEMWVPNLKSIKIIDLAKYFSNKYNKRIEIIGIRPGEKLHELLLYEEEAGKTLLINGCFVVDNNKSIQKLQSAYSSDTSTLSFEELTNYMDKFLTSQITKQLC
jgi:FlaA1/EpsC-like NDP-sugar epimerase